MMSERLNDIFKWMTIVTTIFTPPSFVACVYSMLFEHGPPELHWAYGYGVFWLICIVLVVIMLSFFHRWQWLQKS